MESLYSKGADPSTDYTNRGGVPRISRVLVQEILLRHHQTELLGKSRGAEWACAQFTLRR